MAWPQMDLPRERDCRVAGCSRIVQIFVGACDCSGKSVSISSVQLLKSMRHSDSCIRSHSTSEFQSLRRQLTSMRKRWNNEHESLANNEDDGWHMPSNNAVITLRRPTDKMQMGTYDSAQEFRTLDFTQ
jgi:hypothetical protein